MPTTADELTVARSWMGTTEEDDVFNERFDRMYLAVVMTTLTDDSERRAEALNRAIEESLRSQISGMTLDQPSSASADGNSYSNVQNITALSKQLEYFRNTFGSGTAGIARLYRRIGR